MHTGALNAVACRAYLHAIQLTCVNWIAYAALAGALKRDLAGVEGGRTSLPC
jgi:hypothetical protein